MIVLTSKRFKKSYDHLPRNIQLKTQKSIEYLKEDFQHPSLHTKKVQGKTGVWEVRIDKFYRFTFTKEQDNITLRTIGPHDEAFK